MKTLKTRQLNIFSCWNGFKTIAPKEFTDISEMEKMSKILKIFKVSIDVKVIKMLEEYREVNKDIQGGDKEKAPKALDRKVELDKEMKEFDDVGGQKILSIELEDDVFNTFSKIFDKWGKYFFASIDDFLLCREDITTAREGKETVPTVKEGK